MPPVGVTMDIDSVQAVVHEPETDADVVGVAAAAPSLVHTSIRNPMQSPLIAIRLHPNSLTLSLSWRDNENGVQSSHTCNHALFASFKKP